MPWRGLFITTLIAVLLAVYSVLMHQTDDELTDTAAPGQPGYYLQNAVVTETDATGAARMKLRADNILQNSTDDSITLQNVLLDYQSAPDAKWLLTADRGHLATGSRTIEFSGAVHIKPLDQPGNTIELHTEALSVDTLNNIATAPGKVNFQMDKQRLTATGLRYDLKQQKLQLKSGLHGQFKPQ